MEYKSCGKWYALVAIVLIAAVTILSGIWLRQMTDVLKSPPGKIEVRHVYANFESETKDDKSEETQYTLYKQAEESLREQMNTWLTIVGFFGVLFGLIIPLAGYLLQRHSLSEERERIMEDVQKSAKDAAENASEDAAEAKTAAENAAAGAAKDAAEAKKAAGDATKDAAEAKKAADNAAAEAKKALDEVGAAKEEVKKQLEEALKKIDHASRQAQEAIQGVQEAKAVADMAQKMAREAGKAMQPASVAMSNGGAEKNALKSKLETVKRKAEQGDVNAQVNLGWMYWNADGVTKDEYAAVYWYRKAAIKGDACAQFNLGWAYDCGLGVDQIDAQALYWYRKAAEQNYAPAENNLGCMLEHGQGCEINGKEALEWYYRAAEHGDAMGRKNLGEVYEKSKLGVKQDLAKAKELYRQVVDDPRAGEKAKKLAQEGLDRIAKLEGEK